MNVLKITAAVLTISSLAACAQKSNNEHAKTLKHIQTETTVVNIDKVFEKLDQILSPFEDMTEYALNKNEKGVQKSLNQVLKIEKESIFKTNLVVGKNEALNSKIKTLQAAINSKNYSKTALISTEIFDYNTTHFIDANKIKNQIKIEHLDYLGFQTLALLNQKKIDWSQLEITITNVEKIWKSLGEKVKNHNLKNSFEYLFEGLHLSAKNKDVKMAAIFASMDLSLVDVLENSFE